MSKSEGSIYIADDVPRVYNTLGDSPSFPKLVQQHLLLIDDTLPRRDITFDTRNRPRLEQERRPDI